MKRFAFPLQRVLELWEKQADLEEHRLAELFARRLLLDQRRARIEAERNAAEQELVHAPSVTSSDLMALEGFRQFTVQQKRQIAIGQAECDTLIERQRLAVMEARRKTRLMDKLREQKQQEWKLELDRELEEAAADSFLARLALKRPEIS